MTDAKVSYSPFELTLLIGACVMMGLFVASVVIVVNMSEFGYIQYTDCNIIKDYIVVLDNLEYYHSEAQRLNVENYNLQSRLENFCTLFGGEYDYVVDICILPNDMEI